MACVVPFLIGDAIKIVLASVLAPILRKAAETAKGIGRTCGYIVRAGYHARPDLLEVPSTDFFEAALM